MSALVDPPQAREEWRSLRRLAPEACAALLALEQAAAHGPLDTALLELVKLRASQLNGCSFCAELHASRAQADGASVWRLLQLATWRESPAFTRRERIALQWAEALTLCAGGVDDRAYEQARLEFGDAGLAQLNVALALINLWNRLAVAYRFTPAPAPANAPPS